MPTRCNKPLLHLVGILFPHTKKSCAQSRLYLQNYTGIHGQQNIESNTLVKKNRGTFICVPVFISLLRKTLFFYICKKRRMHNHILNTTLSYM